MRNDELSYESTHPVRVYGLPLVGRYGLAHSLLAWARCELWCRDHGIPMLAPNWNHLRIGPYLRRERDKREYHRLFTFPHYITGLKRAWLLRLPHYPAGKDWTALNVPRHSHILVFKNRDLQNFEFHFPEIAGRAPELQAALRLMTRPEYLPDDTGEPHIAIHVRLGDFSAPPTEGALREGSRNSRLPLQWYVQTLIALRAALGREVPAIIYSDGDDQALASLLAQPEVHRAQSRSAITDLLAMAQASALISSGSGFSIWGCFLGSVPRICFPGQREVRVLGAPLPVDLEPELDFGDPVPADFAACVAGRLR